MIEYDIWTYAPDLTVIPSEGRTVRPDVSSFAVAPEFVSFPEARSERVFKLGFAWDVTRDWHLAKAFWHDHGGRHAVFLMPSWKRDFGVSTLPTSGGHSLTVAVANYAASYLTTTRLDEVGRYVFCYDLTNGLAVAKVLSSADGTPSSVLTLEQAWPFTPTYEAVFGFAILVRFDEDETTWRSLSPQHVKAEFVFRTVRESIITPADGELVEGVAQYQSQPFGVFAETVEDLPQRRNVSYADGPKNFHVVQNALYVMRWACWPSTSGGFRLLRNATDGTITPPDESQGFKSLLTTLNVATTEHVSLAFDQTSYEVIAWQSGTSAKILRWQNNAPALVTFEGWSPILFFNGQVNVQAKIDGTTDVVCYYIRRGSGAICARFQRDAFAIEYVVGGFPHMPLLLLSVATSGLDHILYGMDDGYRKMELVATYPAQPAPLPDPYVPVALDQEAAGGKACVRDFAYENGIIAAALAEAAGGKGSVADTESVNVAPPPTNFAESQGGKAAVMDIACDVVVFGPPTQQEATGGKGSVADITSVLVAIETSSIPENTGGKASITDLYYGP